MTRPGIFAPLLARVAERRTSEPTSSTDGLPARDERAAHWRGPRGISHVVKRSATALALSASLLGVVGLSPSPAAQAQSTPPSALAVSKPVVNILCKFKDESNTFGKTADDVQAMFTGSGGFNDYFQEQSYGAINLAGTATKGWYTLPGTKASYLPGDNIYTGHPALARDCTAAAEAEVNFPSFAVINLWFNDPDLGSQGFTNVSLKQTLNGVTKAWPTTFLVWGSLMSPSLVAHEMGHAFGMGHATGSDARSTWDGHSATSWDPLAGAMLDAPLGPGYVGYHRDVAGWIPANRKFTYHGGGKPYPDTVTLSQLTQPTAIGSLLAQVPLPNGESYTVEYRRKVGFDTLMPEEGVMIYHITPGQGYDATLQAAGGATGTNEDKLWRPNETFFDAANSLKIKVLSVDGAIAKVSIDQGTWTRMAAPPTGLLVANATGTSLSLSWTAADTTAQSVLLRYRPSGSSAWQFIKMPANVTSYTLSGLTSGAAYDLTLQACVGGINDCSAEATLSASTIGTRPNGPSDVTIDNTTTTGFLLHWTDNDSNESGFEIHVSVANDCNSYPIAPTATVPANTTSYKVTGLAPNTTYCAYVTAVNGGGKTSSFPWPSVTTLANT